MRTPAAGDNFIVWLEKDFSRPFQLPIPVYDNKHMSIYRNQKRTKIFTSVVMGLIFLGTFPELSLSQSYSQTNEPFRKYFTNAKPISRENTFFSKNSALDYWNLSPYYQSQITSSACSLAVFTQAVNTITGIKAENGQSLLFTPYTLLEKIQDKSYAERVAENGGGVSLPELAKLFKKHFPKVLSHKVQVHMYRSLRANPISQNELENVLIENEKNKNDIIIVNFLQSALTGDPEGAIGHYAFVGAYNSEQQRVLILDPDREFYEPYWVSLDLLHSGITDEKGKDTKGQYTRGFIRLLIE
jgi:hypothetical protein